MQGIYFIDGETVPTSREFPEGTPTGDFFKKRYNHELPTTFLLENLNQEWQNLWERYASFHAEYAKVISVSVGVLTATKSNPQPLFYVKTFTHKDDEKWILKNLGIALAEAKTLCGHNILEFDCPFLMRRYLINGMPVPSILDAMNKKTWDIPFFDTMKMWSGSAWNYKISQAQLAHLLGVQSSKEGMTGADVSQMYYSMYQDDALPWEREVEVMNQIGEYNAGDVVCNARIYAKMKGFKEIKDVDIFHIKPPTYEPQTQNIQ